MKPPRVTEQAPRRWVADFGKVDGKRRQFVATTQEKAWGKAALKMTLFERAGVKGLAMTAKEVIQASDSFAELRELYDGKVSLPDVMDFYKSHFGGITKMTVAEVFEEHLAAQINKDLRSSSITSTRSVLTGFVKEYGSRQVAAITALDVEEWLAAKEFGSPVTRNNSITYLSVYFNFAKKRGYIMENPVKKVDRSKIQHRMPEYMPVDDVAQMFELAECHVPEIVPALAIGFFGGIRTSELHQLDWSDVKWGKNPIITVRPEVAKNRTARHVTMEPNMQAWLAPHESETGLISPTPRKMGIARGKIIEGKWLHNAMRHTFATMHVAMFDDPARTSLELGHQSQGLLYKNYRGLATKEDAEKFWRIAP